MQLPTAGEIRRTIIMTQCFFSRLPIHFTTALLCTFIIALLGCHKKVQRDLPKVYPVTGEVVAAAGQNVPVGAMIQFWQNDPNLVARGIVEADGSFTLTTVFYEQALSGAAEGVYRAKLLTTKNNGPGPVIELDESYTVEPQKNHFAIKLNGQSNH
jgi:hypothetical protein